MSTVVNITKIVKSDGAYKGCKCQCFLSDKYAAA